VSRSAYPRIASLKTSDAFRAHLDSQAIPLAFDETLAPPGESPLGRPFELAGLAVGNRFCVLPMEGWDGTRDGQPSELTRRRWRHFGESGAKLIWGGEAVAVRHDGRASPNQLLISEHTERALAALREELVSAHRDRFGVNADRDLVIGLQLTHSGRFSKPDAHDRPAPLTAYEHPILDRRFAAPPHVLDDDELDRLVDEFIVAARRAARTGFQFVDIKQCHGYLGHELLGGRSRAGKYGGAAENRFRFVEAIVRGIQSEVPGLHIGVRLSAFDRVAYRKDAHGVGEPADGAENISYGFGILQGEHLETALVDAIALLQRLRALGVRWVCVTAGSPYYNPHITRPAYFPPADGYWPPEDPLRGVLRQIRATALLKAAFPDMALVGSAYSYLQEWLPHVAQHNVREGLTDFVGLGRMMLAYPRLAADVLAGNTLERGAICRSFSDCTTGPRMGFVSGCYPLDRFYTERPEAASILEVRTALSAARR
jgi:2,4-dienoyl-CoA reductase-like NADH-dependent reductase (Old Yellow Enzyme family)